MSTLNELKAEYQAKLDTQVAEQAEQDTQREALRQLKLDGLKPRIITWIANREGVDEAELSQYGEVTGDWNIYEDTKLHYAIFTLTLPEHQPVTFVFYEDNEGKVKPNQKWWKVGQSGRSLDTLGEALTLAYQIYQDNQAYIARETVESQEYEASQTAKKEQDAREQKQQQDILIELAKDPVTFLLLKLFAEIQSERANLRNEIDSLNEAMGNADYHYDEIMAESRRKIEQERQEIGRVKDTARNLQYQVDDLENELTKAKKRGW